ncbi:MAG: hypothetical protein WB689_32945, partial [Xanthobacteraceae bacterium]
VPDHVIANFEGVRQGTFSKRLTQVYFERGRCRDAHLNVAAWPSEIVSFALHLRYEHAPLVDTS